MHGYLQTMIRLVNDELCMAEKETVKLPYKDFSMVACERERKVMN